MTSGAELLTPVQQESVGYATPGLSDPLTFAQFDPSLGTLVEVRLTIVGTLDSTVSTENLGPIASTETVIMPGTVTLQAPSGLAMVSAYPSFAASFNLGAFDGSKDFAGSSGTIASNIITTGTQQAAFQLTNDSEDQAAFTGTGSVNLALTSQVLGGIAGGGNLLDELQSMTGASVSLQYGYVAAGPTVTPVGGGDSGATLVTSSPSGSLITFPSSVTTTAQTFVIPDSRTDWTQQIAVSRFDPSLGTLYAINVGLVGDATGGFAVENLGNTSITATTQQAAKITLGLPGTTTVSVEPTLPMQSFNLGTYDGTQDFAGTSGTLVQGLTEPIDPSVTQSVTDVSALTVLTGSGTQALTITAAGTSAANGSGNMLTQLTQQSGATVTVSYTYLPGDLACFAAGTRIATPNGPVAVQDIQLGQHVSLASGGSAPVVWLGHRRVDCRRHPRPETVWPVRIVAGAFAPGVPVRDLLLSPDHAVAFQGSLIPVRYLVNGDSVAQQRIDNVAYYHIELPRHALMLAEGLAAESFLDTGNRSAFANGGVSVQGHSNFANLAWEAAGCAPLVVTGPLVEAARAQLRVRAKAPADRRPRAA